MSTFVLRCGDVPVPITLASLPLSAVAAIPAEPDYDELLRTLDSAERPRLIVLGGDAALSSVLTRLMRTERLHVEIGYVPVENSSGARIHRTGTGVVAAKRAIEGTAAELPLIRDDAGIVLVGRAVLTGPDGGCLEGEAYVDETRLFSGKIAAVHVAPTIAMPGLRAFVDRGKRFTRRRWVSGRAMQLGTAGAVVIRDGVPNSRELTRSAFYRHSEPWLLVH